VRPSVILSAVEGEALARLGRNLRAHRVAEGLSQEAFAEALGVHRTYIGALERGERNLQVRTVERLADRLDVTVHDLLCR
jgi:transcriptional regulator with XRE-family HTH domain